LEIKKEEISEKKRNLGKQD